MQPHHLLSEEFRKTLGSFVPVEDFLMNFICSSCVPIFHVKLQRMVSATAGLGLEAGLKQLDPPGVGRFVLYTKLQRTKRKCKSDRVMAESQNGLG